MFFQRVVLLLIQSTRWQQNAFKYLLNCHHSLYPFITPCLCSHSQKSILLLLLYSWLPIWWPLSPPASFLYLSGDHRQSLNHKDCSPEKNDVLYETLLKWSFYATTLGQIQLPVSDPTFQDKVRDSRKKKSRNQCIWSKYMILGATLKALSGPAWLAKEKYIKVTRKRQR